MGAGNYVTSCNLRVFADEAAEPVPAQNVHTGHSARCMHASCGGFCCSIRWGRYELYTLAPHTLFTGGLRLSRPGRAPQRDRPPISIESMLNAWSNPMNCCMTFTTRFSCTVSTLPAGPVLTG